MVLASSAGFTAVVAQAGHKIPVLAMVRSVPAGAVVTAGDLREVRLGVGDAAGYVVPAAEKDQVVGETATVPLVAGALLVAGNIMLVVGLHLGDLAVMAVLNSLYPLGTVLLAMVLLRERLTLLQGIGIGLALASAITLSVVTA